MTTTRRRFALGAAALPLLPTALSAQEAAAPLGLELVRETALGLDQLHALVIRQGDETLLEVAPRGAGLDRAANVKSVSKTLLALLTGIAIDRGVLEGPEQRVLPILGRRDFGDARDALTIGHLLSMRGGLASTSGPNYGPWVESADWVGFVLEGDLVDRPGGRYIYSTGSWHVLGAALAEAAGEDLLTLARRWLGGPLDIDFAAWERDPQGYYLGGNQMALSPRHLARVGEMVLAGGRWNGGVVVPEAWIDESWRSRGRSRWTGDGYGYGWFLSRLGGTRMNYGRGYGGQVLAVAPELDLSVAITSDPNRPARSGGYFGDLRRLLAAIARAPEVAV